MGELDTAFFFLAGFIVLIGVLFLQWLHKLGFKLAKVETSEIPLEASEIPGFSIKVPNSNRRYVGWVWVDVFGINIIRGGS